MTEVFEQFGWRSILDIIIISIFIHYALLLVKGTRTAQTLTGVLVVVAIFLISSIIPLTTVNWVMNKFYSSIILILVVLFQDELRHALSRIGKRSLIQVNEGASSQHMLDEIARAAFSLAKIHVGALVVIERNIILSRYIDIGTLINGRISKELILAIFRTQSPLHDGAVIIQKGQLTAAGCFLPLTRDEDLSKDWGTRHRAAIGISQETDAIVVLVSEEKGEVSVVIDGTVLAAANRDILKRILQRALLNINQLSSSEKNAFEGARKNV